MAGSTILSGKIPYQLADDITGIGFCFADDKCPSKRELTKIRIIVSSADYLCAASGIIIRPYLHSPKAACRKNSPAVGNRPGIYYKHLEDLSIDKKIILRSLIKSRLSIHLPIIIWSLMWQGCSKAEHDL